MKNIFIIGSKGIPAKYGGFETFVEYLTARKSSGRVKYHVACLGEDSSEFNYNNARCFNIKVPNVGSSRAVLYDILSLKESIRYIKENQLRDCIIYILACRIGPFFNYYKKKLENMGVQVFVNPDGHEWKRSKWNIWVKRYWKFSEKLMVKNSDLLVCDSKGIEGYIRTEYNQYKPKTKFIAYGADIEPSKLNTKDHILIDWFKEHNVKSKQYYLVVGRFVPENNYEVMIKEFMKSSTTKDFILIANIEANAFYERLKQVTNFEQDKRIKFVGTVYDQELLKKIREEAYGYFHGHEVGGTNPSLLESLASTNLNLLLDVVFNKEVGRDSAVYFSKEKGSLASLINEVENFSDNQIESFGYAAKERIRNEYSWDKIIKEYETLFLGE
ncbi:beta 1-4 rhamnosyltransferase Cps2T [Peribacillus frigoritolerans]